MILRRLSQSLKEQNWTAIWIEFILLVSGVFLGIQVANWNEERQTRQKADGFSTQLMADLRLTSWNYQYFLEYYRDVRAAAEKTVAALSSGAPLSNEDLLINAYRATQYKTNASRRSTYDELVSTGNLGLISDSELRRKVVRIYGNSAIDSMAREGVESRYRQWFRMRMPTEVQRALGKQCGDKYILPGDYTNFDKIIDYPCKTGLSEQAIDAAAEALRSDPEALQLLRLRIADMDTRLYDLTSNNRDAYEFLLDIAKEKP
jgi:hypothetical protein